MWSSLLKVKTELFGVPILPIRIAHQARGVRGAHTGVYGFGNLLFALAEDEELESGSNVRRVVKHDAQFVYPSYGAGIFRVVGRKKT